MKQYYVYIRFNNSTNTDTLYKTEVTATNTTTAMTCGINKFFNTHPTEVHGNITRVKAALKG